MQSCGRSRKRVTFNETVKIIEIEPINLQETSVVHTTDLIRFRYRINSLDKLLAPILLAHLRKSRGWHVHTITWHVHTITWHVHTITWHVREMNPTSSHLAAGMDYHNTMPFGPAIHPVDFLLWRVGCVELRLVQLGPTKTTGLHIPTSLSSPLLRDERRPIAAWALIAMTTLRARCGHKNRYKHASGSIHLLIYSHFNGTVTCLIY